MFEIHFSDEVDPILIGEAIKGMGGIHVELFGSDQTFELTGEYTDEGKVGVIEIFDGVRRGKMSTIEAKGIIVL